MSLSTPNERTCQHPLDPLFDPASIAVIGASSDPRKIGGRPIAYMLRSGFDRPLYPINPRQAEVQGLQTYASLEQVGRPVDQVIIAVAGEHVQAAVEEAVVQRARSIIVFSSGFAEMGETGRQAQDAIAQRCSDAGIPLVGPNCIGVFSAARNMYSTFMTAIEHELFGSGTVGIASQSGAIGSYLYGMAGDRGVRFSNFIATGNEAGVDVADCIDWMAQDPATAVIMVYLEGCRDGERLYRALERARVARKPVIVMKVGRSEQGAAAAASHTGSLAGADTVYDAILRETNAWRANSLEEMVDLAYACSNSTLPRGARLGVITPSGGVGVIAADEASRCGLTLPTLPLPTQQEIRRIIPFASGVNPIDTTAQTVGDRSLYTRILQIVFEHAEFDSVLSFNASMGRSEAEFAKVRASLYALRRAHPEKLVALSMRATPEIAAELASERILYFPDPSRATATIGALAQIAAGFGRVSNAGGMSSGGEALPEGPLDESGARRVLERAGVPFVSQSIVRSADEAVAAGQAFGCPVVMKVLSADIAHKSDVGGVLLNLKDSDAIRRGWTNLMERVGAACPTAVIEGALISPMVTGGVETVIGAVRDPVFGPMVMFGLGGIFVEIFKDVTFRRAPVSLQTAREMVNEIRGLPLLKGARGKPEADLEAIAKALVAVSEFAAAHRATVSSVEINPFMALPQGGCAVDALILR